jgi:hypothetical protein
MKRSTKTMKSYKLSGLLLILLLSLSCNTKKNNIQQEENKTIIIANDVSKEEKQNDETLRLKFPVEIELANKMISKLEEFYSQYTKYPQPVDFIFEELKQQISNEAGITFYYTWLNTQYVLTYELPDGTGLIYSSEKKAWTISKYLP